MRTSIWFVAPVAFALASSANADQFYEVTDLGSLGGYSVGTAISSNGQVAGHSITSTGKAHAFRYSGGVMQDLGTLGGNHSYAYGINASGQVVGAAQGAGANTKERAFLFDNGVMTDLGTQFGPTYSGANSINDSGLILGGASTTAFGGVLVYYGGSWHDLGLGLDSRASAINSSGQIAGYIMDASTNHKWMATIFSAGTTTYLGALSPNQESWGQAINSLGEVVGISYGDNVAHAFLYSAGTLTDLGTLGGTYSTAKGINSSGLIVGTADTAAHIDRAFIATNGMMADLNDWIIPTQMAYQLFDARAINDDGWIVANGFNPNGDNHALLLKPYSPPSPATQVAWSAAQGGSWSAPANWNPNIVPDGNSYSTVIDSPSSALPLIVTLDGTRTIHDLTVNGASGVTINSGTAGSLKLEIGTSGSPWTMIRIDTGVHTINAPLILDSSNYVRVQPGAHLNMAGAISDGAAASSLTLYGGGTVSLSGNNTFSGGLSIAAATVQVSTVNNAGASGPFGSNSAVTLTGFYTTTTIEYTGSTASSNMPFSISSYATATWQIDQPSATLTLTGAISGAGGLMKTGPGTLVLPNSNSSFSGGAVVANGVLKIGSSGALGTAHISVDPNGSLVLDAGVNITQTVSLQGAGYNPGTGALGALTTTGGNVNLARVEAENSDVTINTGGGNLSIEEMSTGPFSLVLTGGGTIACDYIGPLDSGPTTLLIDHTTLTNNGNTQVDYIGIQNTGTLRTTVSKALYVPIDLLPGGGTIDVPTVNTTFTLSSSIVGVGPLTKTGAAKLTLTEANSYTGNTTVTAGTLQLSGSGSFANSPRISVASGATLDVSGVTGGANFSGGRFSLASGQMLKGFGNVVGAVGVDSGAIIVPGDTVGSPGLLSLQGNYSQNGTGKLEIEIGGTSPGSTGYDVLSITGAASLGGTLTVTGTSAGGVFFAPAVGQSFDILTATGGVSGTFAIVGSQWVTAGELVHFSTTYGANKVTLQITSIDPLPQGDANGDGIVDVADYVNWQRAYGSHLSAADFDQNGIVDSGDYILWRKNSGFAARGASSAARSNVPEPTSIVLALLGMLLLATRFQSR